MARLSTDKIKALVLLDNPLSLRFLSEIWPSNAWLAETEVSEQVYPLIFTVDNF
jgi:hypothetical protein